MDILLINGSPRKNGNTQMILNLYAEMLQKQENTTHTDMISLARCIRTISLDISSAHSANFSPKVIGSA